jgi:hypothetical protein
VGESLPNILKALGLIPSTAKIIIKISHKIMNSSPVGKGRLIVCPRTEIGILDFAEKFAYF